MKEWREGESEQEQSGVTWRGPLGSPLPLAAIAVTPPSLIHISSGRVSLPEDDGLN